MGYSAQAGHVFLRAQSAQGTYAADLDTAGIGIKLRSGNLGPTRELLIPDPEIGGGRDVVDAYLGTTAFSGDYEFYARMNQLPSLLYAALGIKSTSTTTGISTHTITPSDASQLPYYSIEEQIGSGLEVFNYTDAVLNTLHLEAEANGYLMGTAGFIAAMQTAGNTAEVVAFDDTPMIVGTNILVTYNGVTLPAHSFSLDINNNIADDDFRLGSFYLGGLDPKRREVTASFNIRAASSALWRQATYGVSSATEAGGLTTKQQLVITCTTYESIPGGTPTTSYTLALTFPKFALRPFSFSVSGDDIIDNDIEGQAVRPVSGTPIVTAVVKDNQAAIA